MFIHLARTCFPSNIVPLRLSLIALRTLFARELRSRRVFAFNLFAFASRARRASLPVMMPPVTRHSRPHHAESLPSRWHTTPPVRHEKPPV